MRTPLPAVVTALLLGCTALAPAAAYAPGKAAAPAPLVDINSASLAELKTLPGIGDKEAARIVAARPYPSKAKLVADGVLPMATFSTLKDRIEARQPGVKAPAATQTARDTRREATPK